MKYVYFGQTQECPVPGGGDVCGGSPSSCKTVENLPQSRVLILVDIFVVLLHLLLGQLHMS